MAQINIAAETVREGLDRILAEGVIDQAGHDSIFWYFNHCRANDWDQERATGEIKKTSWTTLYRVFQGTYEASYDKIINSINRVKTITEQRAKLSSIDYIETSTWETVRDVCDNALIGQEISTINGNSQIGKTAAIEHYIKINPNKRIVYLRMPASPNKSLFYEAFGRACFLAGNRNLNTMRTAIVNHIDDRTLIILDETHQLFLSTEKTAVAILEFIREIYDAKKCGVVLIGTNVLNHELNHGRHAKVYKQLMMRGLIHAQLPDRTPTADVQMVASRFGLTDNRTADAKSVIDQINADNGLGVLLKVLRSASTKAKKSNQAITWNHFVQAWVILQKLSRKHKEQ